MASISVLPPVVIGYFAIWPQIPWERDLHRMMLVEVEGWYEVSWVPGPDCGEVSRTPYHQYMVSSEHKDPYWLSFRTVLWVLGRWVWCRHNHPHIECHPTIRTYVTLCGTSYSYQYWCVLLKRISFNFFQCQVKTYSPWMKENSIESPVGIPKCPGRPADITVLNEGISNE